jgi:hypothetical protein
MPRNLLVIAIVLIILFAAFDRGQRVHYSYPGGLGAVLVLILVLGLIFGWF